MNIFYPINLFSRSLFERFIVSLLLINLIFQVNLIKTGNMKVDFSKVDVNALRDEIKHVDDFLQSLPPDEKRRIEEEVMREVEKLSDEEFQQIIDLSEKVMQPEKAAKQPTVTPLPALPSLKTEKEAANLKEQKQQELLQKEIESILEVITKKMSIAASKIKSLHRVSEDHLTEQQWHSIYPSFEQTESLIHRLLNPITTQSDILISQLTQDKYVEIVKKLKNLHQILVKNEPSISVPDVMGLKYPNGLEKEDEALVIDPMTKKRSIQAVKMLIKELTGLSLTALNSQIEGMIKKIAPKEFEKRPKSPDLSGVIPEHLSKRPKKDLYLLPEKIEEKKSLPTISQQPVISAKSDFKGSASQLKEIFANIKDLLDYPTLKEIIEYEKKKKENNLLEMPLPLEKKLDSLSLTALESIREHGRKVTKILKSISHLSEEEKQELRRMAEESSFVPFASHMGENVDALDKEAQEFAALSRVAQTYQQLQETYNRLISSPAKK